jgi:F-type H+-transporting ATPase subunit b
MRFDWSTFVLQTVNFAILVWLLHRFLYKPVLGFVDARRAEIDGQFAEVRAAEACVEAERTAIKSERAGIAGERVAAMRDAATRAEQEAAARREQAEREAAALLDAARKALSDERTRALTEVRREALDLGAQIAGRLLAQVPPALRAEAWIERIERYFAELPETEAGALRKQLVNNSALKVVTASALPNDVAELWSSRLKRCVGSNITIDYGVDAGLIAGAELHFPNAILRFSWQTALDAMRAEIEANGNAH